MSGLGPTFMRIWICGNSPRSGSRNAWTKITNVNGASRLNKFGIFSARSKWFPVAIGNHGRNLVVSLWLGDKATINGVVEKRLTPPQNFQVQKSAGKVLACLDFLVSSRHPPQWLSPKGPNYQHGVLLISAGKSEWHFEGKTPPKIHQGGLVLARQCPGSPGTCKPEETGLTGLPSSWSPTLFSGSVPVGLPPVSWTEKTIQRLRFLVRRGGHCCRGDLVGWTTFWILIFFYQ